MIQNDWRETQKRPQTTRPSRLLSPVFILLFLLLQYFVVYERNSAKPQMTHSGVLCGFLHIDPLMHRSRACLQDLGDSEAV